MPTAAVAPPEFKQQNRLLLELLTMPCLNSCTWFCVTAASRARRCRLHCTANAGAGTPVAKNSILVVGGTGTLGRQVVRKALDEGYEVRCIVKPRMNPADFLRDWGATTVQVRSNRAVCSGSMLAGSSLQE
jgi:hypothetical protein